MKYARMPISTRDLHLTSVRAGALENSQSGTK